MPRPSAPTVVISASAGWTVASSLLAGRIERFTPGYYDEGIYRLLARNLMHEGFFGYAPGVNVALRPPGYPGFLAVVRTVVDAQWAVRGVQAVLAGAVVLLCAWIASTLFDRRAGAATAAVLATTGVLAAYASFELSETLATFLIVAAAAALIRGTDGAAGSDEPRSNDRSVWRWTAPAGALAGAAALTRPQALIVVPFVAAWLVFSRRRSARWRPAAVFVLAAVAVVVPWTVRNAVVLDAFVPVSTYGGVNLWLANNPRATGDFPGSAAMWLEPAEYARISALPEAEEDREWFRRAFAYMRSNPLRTVRNWVRDAVVFAGARDVYPRDRLVLRDAVRLPLLDDRVLWILAIPAAWAAARSPDRRLMLPGVIIAASLMFFMVYLPLARYRHGVHPFLAVYAGALVPLGLSWRDRRRSRKEAG